MAINPPTNICHPFLGVFHTSHFFAAKVRICPWSLGAARDENGDIIPWKTSPRYGPAKLSELDKAVTFQKTYNDLDTMNYYSSEDTFWNFHYETLLTQS